MGITEKIFDGPKNRERMIALAHGAGAPMDSEFMNAFAKGLGEREISVMRFEFKYMRESRKSGVKRPPSSINCLIDEWEQIFGDLNIKQTVIGGKSMGGRVASMLASKRGSLGLPVSGVIALGYPFHPPGKKNKLRTSHLESLEAPMLICQGERDIFGGRKTVESLELPKTISFHWLKDGDHSFKPREKSGLTLQSNYNSAIEAVAKFIKKRVV